MINLCKAMEYLPVPPCFPLQHPDHNNHLSQNIVGLEVLEARGALVLDDGHRSRIKHKKYEHQLSAARSNTLGKSDRSRREGSGSGRSKPVVGLVCRRRFTDTGVRCYEVILRLRSVFPSSGGLPSEDVDLPRDNQVASVASYRVRVAP